MGSDRGQRDVSCDTVRVEGASLETKRLCQMYLRSMTCSRRLIGRWRLRARLVRCNLAVIVSAALVVMSGRVFSFPQDQKKAPGPEDRGAAWFGRAVSLSGDTALVGAPRDDGRGKNAGAAYVFHYDGSDWVEEAKLLAADGDMHDDFGSSLALDGDWALIGAPRNGEQGKGSGAAYVFRFDGSAWVQEAKLLPAGGEAEDSFGVRVALSGDTALVGAIGDDERGMNAGAAYVFYFDGSSWLQEEKLLSDDLEAGDFFGTGVAIDGETALIGAMNDDARGLEAGAAYVFRFDGSAWVEEAKLLPDPRGLYDHFGASTSISADTLVIGAPRDNDRGLHAGAAYVFYFDGIDWIREAKLAPPDVGARDLFGFSADVSGDTVLIGALWDDDRGRDAGAAYVFQYDGSRWMRRAKLLADSGDEDHNLGSGVAIGPDTALVGSWNRLRSLGAAYVFRNDGSAWWEQETKLMAADGRLEDLTRPIRCGSCVRDPDWLCDGDVNGDREVNAEDVEQVEIAFGRVDRTSLCSYDLDCDGQITPMDSGIVQSLFGTCEEPREVCP